MLRRCMLLPVALCVAACDIPTGPPAWVQKWVIPTEAIEVHVAELLPDGVMLSEDGTLFRTTTEAVEFSQTLADMCPACEGMDGTLAPKPEFSDTLYSTSVLPAELVAAVLAGGDLEVAMTHDMDFDPLRPSADDEAERGYLVILVSSNGTVVARDSIDGADVPFPPGTTLVPSLPVQPGSVTNVLELEVRLFSPAGDPAWIEESDQLAVTFAASTVDIAEATIAAAFIDLVPTSEEMEPGAVDSAMVERIQGGALRFDIENPFNLSGQLELAFDLGTETIHNTIQIGQGTFQRRVTMTGAQLRALLYAETVTITTSGELTSNDATITVTPTQQMVMQTSFELDILIGGDEEGGQ